MEDQTLGWAWYPEDTTITIEEVKGMKVLNEMSSEVLEKYMDDEINRRQFHISVHTDDESLYNEICAMVENRCNTEVD